ncbi:MAG: hypothetical protein NXI32_28130, partial [bacterium]|nr:hypothetical protein [bacterium]
LTIKRSGGGNLYWNVYSQNFSMEDDFAEAGLEVKVQRKYYLLRPAKEKLQLADQNASVYDSRKSAYDRVPVSELKEIGSGELVEVDLLIESKNDYEYLIVEDPRAAGLEFVDAESGYFFSGGLLLYRELREKKTGLCIEHLPRGKYSVTYRLRSEAPGQFIALPATIQGMYAPELVGNSTDIDLKVSD